MASTQRALVLEAEGKDPSIRELSADAFGDGEVTIEVNASSLNYKDGLALLGKARVVRSFPMVPGIDLAGRVVQSSSASWQPGDVVIATGWGAGETHWGGYAEMATARADWLVRAPEQLLGDPAMALGTAGLTAMLAILALEHQGLTKDERPVLVTGAGGGVGSLAVMLLARAGYSVSASTGRPSVHADLRRLGASEIVSREEFSATPDRPLGKARWSGAIDTVGGATLAGVLPGMAPGSAVASCGNAGGNSFESTVLPFILRGVNILGIDSNYCPIERRRAAWDRLAQDTDLELLDSITTRAQLEDLPAFAERILNGQIHGRVVVNPRKA